MKSPLFSIVAPFVPQFTRLLVGSTSFCCSFQGYALQLEEFTACIRHHKQRRWRLWLVKFPLHCHPQRFCWLNHVKSSEIPTVFDANQFCGVVQSHQKPTHQKPTHLPPLDGYNRYIIEKKFRSQTSDNMDRWKSRGGKSQRREEEEKRREKRKRKRKRKRREEKESEERVRRKRSEERVEKKESEERVRRESQKKESEERVSRKKMLAREKVRKSRNTVFF